MTTHSQTKTSLHLWVTLENKEFIMKNGGSESMRDLITFLRENNISPSQAAIQLQSKTELISILQQIGIIQKNNIGET